MPKRYLFLPKPRKTANRGDNRDEPKPRRPRTLASCIPTAPQKAQQLLNSTFAAEIREKMRERDSQTSEDPQFYGASWASAEPHGTAHVAVITEDYAVSVTSTVNTE